MRTCGVGLVWLERHKGRETLPRRYWVPELSQRWSGERIKLAEAGRFSSCKFLSRCKILLNNIRQVSRLYYAHLDPYVGPQLSKASVALSPYVSTFNTKVFNPYIRPVIEAYLPISAFTPEPPKTFWSMIADKLPNVGSHVAETKGSMSDFYADVGRASKPADVPIPHSAPKRHARDMDRAELEAIREAIKLRVEKQGQKGYMTVHDEVN